jgi:hypothetical protein
MQFIIDQKVAQGILNYLVERPYKEVVALITEMSKMTPVPEPGIPQKAPGPKSKKS